VPEGARSAARSVPLREDVATITTPPVAHGETVLVVDDEPDVEVCFDSISGAVFVRAAPSPCSSLPGGSRVV